MNIYDFDETIYGSDSTMDFIFFSIKKHPSLIRYLPLQGVAVVKHYVLKMTKKTAMKEQFYRIFRGYDAEALLEEFWDAHEHKVYSWYKEQQQESDIVISASPEFLLKPICARLGIKHLIASRVDPKTGKYTGLNCHGPEKVVRLKDELGFDHCEKFYSDAYSDQPLADIADEAFMIVKGKITPWGK